MITRLFFTCLLSSIIIVSALAQGADFSIKVSTDSLLFGNHVEVSFLLENAKGDNFEPPIFDAFHIVSGPNVSSSFSMINGAVTQSVSYSYYLEPKDIGNYFIAPASIEIDSGILETAPLEIMVVPNSDGIKQNPASSREPTLFPFDPELPFKQPQQQQKAKKKRKIYKM